MSTVIKVEMESSTCLICSAESFSPPCSYNNETIHNNKTIDNAIKCIFKYLIIPSKNLDPSFKTFCPSCFLIIDEIVQFQKKIELFELQIKCKVESLGKIITETTTVKNLLSKAGKNSKESVIWEEFKKPVVQNYLDGILPNPSVRLRKDNVSKLKLDLIGRPESVTCPSPTHQNLEAPTPPTSPQITIKIEPIYYEETEFGTEQTLSEKCSESSSTISNWNEENSSKSSTKEKNPCISEIRKTLLKRRLARIIDYNDQDCFIDNSFLFGADQIINQSSSCKETGPQNHLDEDSFPNVKIVKTVSLKKRLRKNRNKTKMTKRKKEIEVVQLIGRNGKPSKYFR